MTTVTSRRAPSLPLANFRDVGGLALAAGTGRTLTGRLYRGDAPYSRADLPVTADSLDWDTVVDLRSAREFGADIAWDHRANHYRVALLDAAAPERLRGALTDLYVDLVRRGGPGLVEVCQHVASAQGPTLVHCSFGKDRTGIAIAVILLAVGVDREAVINDYRLSHAVSGQVLDRLVARGLRRPPSDQGHLLAAPTEAIEAALEVLDRWPGAAPGYLRDSGASDDTLRALRLRLAGLQT